MTFRQYEFEPHDPNADKRHRVLANVVLLAILAILLIVIVVAAVGCIPADGIKIEPALDADVDVTSPIGSDLTEAAPVLSGAGNRQNTITVSGSGGMLIAGVASLAIVGFVLLTYLYRRRGRACKNLQEEIAIAKITDHTELQGNDHSVTDGVA